MKKNKRLYCESGIAAIGFAVILAIVVSLCIYAVQTQMTTYFKDFKKTKIKLDAEILSENFAVALKENYDLIAPTPGMASSNKQNYPTTDTLLTLIKSGKVSLCVPFPKEFIDVTKLIRGDCVKLDPTQISQFLKSSKQSYANSDLQFQSELKLTFEDQLNSTLNALVATISIPKAHAQSAGTDMAMPQLVASKMPAPINLTYNSLDTSFNDKYLLRCKDGATAEPPFECITISFCSKAGSGCNSAELIRTTYVFYTPPTSSLEN